MKSMMYSFFVLLVYGVAFGADSMPIQIRENEISKLVTSFIADYHKWNAAANTRFADPRCYDKSSGVSIMTQFGSEADAITTKEFNTLAKKYFIRDAYFRSFGIPASHDPEKEKVSSIKQLDNAEWRVITDVNIEIAGVKSHHTFHYFIRTEKTGRLYIDFIMYRDDKVDPPLVYQEL